MASGSITIGLDVVVEAVRKEMQPLRDEIMQLKRPENTLPIVAEVVRKEMQPLRDEIKQLKRPENTLSPAGVGSQVLSALKLESSFHEIPATEGPAILSEETAAILSKIGEEKVLVVHLTHILGKILTKNLVIVNSEEYKWLEQAPDLSEGSRLKPDLFVTYHGVFCHRDEPRDKGRELRQTFRKEYQEIFYFGIPEEMLHDSIVIMDVKLKLSFNEAFGKVVIYLQKLPESSRAVLFDNFQCWLIQSRGHVVVKVWTFKWTDSGSSKVFSDFVEGGLGSWLACLSSACDTFGVHTVNSDSFLGAGAHGRVFKVVTENNTLAALKIVSKNLSILSSESRALADASTTGIVAKVLKPFTKTSNGAAMLIAPVGQPVLRSSLTETRLLQILKCLFKLHSAGLEHGDPRLANIIQHEDQLLWIDFMDSMKSTDGWISDARILSRSILNLSHQTVLPPQVSAAISSYGCARTEYSCENLGNELWSILRKDLELWEL
ncbi:hypothetical protein BDR26DRAFT_919438 [Obelidium mucronatum]|nr:hypothetical protein BDR26DRAFT_919438 [Obelidium mucronatum]